MHREGRAWYHLRMCSPTAPAQVLNNLLLNHEMEPSLRHIYVSYVALLEASTAVQVPFVFTFICFFFPRTQRMCRDVLRRCNQVCNRRTRSSLEHGLPTRLALALALPCAVRLLRSHQRALLTQSRGHPPLCRRPCAISCSRTSSKARPAVPSTASCDPRFPHSRIQH